MALDSVKTEIDKSAADAAAAIKAEASAEVAKILAEADKEIAVKKEKEDKRLEEAVERLRRQELSSAELESKKVVLAKKKEILEKAFVSALASLEGASDAEKLKQYKEMIDANKGVIKNPKVYVPKGSKITAADLGVSSVEEDSMITGGIILESEDGTIQLDLQYKTLLQTIWEREIKSLSDILFG